MIVDFFLGLADLPFGLLICITLLFSMIVGSFLNVIIYRLPIIMEKDYQSQAREILELPAIISEKYNLFLPRSQCRSCGRMITALDNIPVVSYLMIKGKCRGCGDKISIFYPAVELLTGLLGVWVIWHFGANARGFFALFFVFYLVSLTGIDLKVQLLPDIMTLTMMWLGIILGFYKVYLPLSYTVVGAIIGYLFLWSVSVGFKIITKRDGMGLGDAKLLAALCAWINVNYLPIILLLACFSGIITAVAGKFFKKNNLFNNPIPFGPHLAIGGFIAFLYGEEIFRYYTHLMIIR